MSAANEIDNERLDELERHAARQAPGPHDRLYDGGCVWCRADNPEFLGGGSHEFALQLIAELRAARAELEKAKGVVKAARVEVEMLHRDGSALAEALYRYDEAAK